MPFAKAQSVIKKMLPERDYGSLYNSACKVYDVYQSIKDNIFYRIPSTDAEVRQMKKILRAIKSHTMTSRVGLLATYAIAVQSRIDNLQGAFVECGVARGGCAAMMALVAGGSRKTWLFDSYEGLPEQSDKDGQQKPVRGNDRTANDLAKGYCLGTFEDVEHLLYTKLQLNRGRVLMVRGWFDDTLPVWRDNVGDIAVLRLDCDWYESTMCCLKNLYDSVVEGGWVIIDDYQLPGCKKAVNDFLQDRKQKQSMIYDANGRAYLNK